MTGFSSSQAPQVGVAGWRRKRRGGRPRHISDRLDYLGKQAARRPVNHGIDDASTIQAGLNLSVSLTDLKRYEEARSIQRKIIPVALRILGAENDTTLLLLRTNVRSVYSDPKATLADLRQTERSMRDVLQRTRQIYGASHPDTQTCERFMHNVKQILAKRDSGGA